MKQLLPYLSVVFALLAISCQTLPKDHPDKTTNVVINGAVKYPKHYSIPADTKVDELIQYAGGYERVHQEDSYTETPAGLSIVRERKTIRIPFREWKSKKWEKFRFLEGDIISVDIWIF